MKTSRKPFKFLITCILLMTAGKAAFAQIRFEGYSQDAAKAPIHKLYRFLKDAPTDLRLPEENLQPSKAPLYDKVLASYFDNAVMTQKLGERDVDVRIQYQALYGIDKSIDQVPADSVFAMPAGYYYGRYPEDKPADQADWAQRYVVGYIIAGKHYPMLDVCLAGNQRFAYIMPYIYYDREKGKVVEEFALRHRKPS
ncbi:hypothetical protein [Chitinophaga rhizosphaerae]|uniref:hypothetical protein n=1 Tax=Chitinophaga rhizosphaerae TaxID=1864947 RepID=UPI000F815EB1|nr:hypothetical protein [Chitinophaga rhizosphaerae]